MGIECSAKYYQKLIDVVFCAQRAVLFPIAPLQDSQTKQLMPDFERALLRIFRIVDRDGDGYLDDREISILQSQVFQGDLQKQHIEGLKEFLRHECDDYGVEEAQNGISFSAFKSLMKIFIKKMKLQACWLILEHYGYNQELRIAQNYLVGNDIIRQEHSEKWENVECSQRSIDFLEKVFMSSAKKHGTNYYLGTEEIVEVFKPSIEGVPWDIKKETKVEEHGITLETWIALWQKIFSHDYKKAFESLVYLGYCDPFEASVCVRKNRLRELLREVKREVFNCYVIGSKGAGKSTFIEGCLNEINLVEDEEPEEQKSEPSRERSIVISKEQTLVLQELRESNVQQMLGSDFQMRKCDVVALFYDGSHAQANYLTNVITQIPQEIPKVLFRTKSDDQSIASEISLEDLGHQLKVQVIETLSSSND